MSNNELTHSIIGCAMDIHKVLGPGLLESAYKECLYFKLIQSKLYVEKEKSMPLVYEKVKLDCGYRIDLLVENKIVIEVKSVDFLNNIHMAKTLTMLFRYLPACKVNPKVVPTSTLLLTWMV